MWKERAEKTTEKSVWKWKGVFHKLLSRHKKSKTFKIFTL